MSTLLSAHPDLVSWVLIPLLIFVARIVDVSLGTVRFILIARGQRHWAPVVGFFEILIWILAIGQIMSNLANPVCYIAYAAGFASGTYIGLWIAAKLSLGVVMVRILTQREATQLIVELRNANHGVTVIDAEGKDGPVKVIFTIVQRRHAQKVIDAIKRHNPQAFYTLEEVGYVESGVFASNRLWRDSVKLSMLKPFRKGK